MPDDGWRRHLDADPNLGGAARLLVGACVVLPRPPTSRFRRSPPRCVSALSPTPTSSLVPIRSILNHVVQELRARLRREEPQTASRRRACGPASTLLAYASPRFPAFLAQFFSLFFLKYL